MVNHDWDAFRLRPQGVPVDPAFRNTPGRGAADEHLGAERLTEGLAESSDHGLYSWKTQVASVVRLPVRVR